jgi:hypothetical protein
MIHMGREVVRPGYSRGPTTEASTRRKSPTAQELTRGVGSRMQLPNQGSGRSSKRGRDEHDKPKKDTDKALDQGRGR